VLRLPTDEPLLSEILASVDVVDIERTPVLRQVLISSGDTEDGEVTLLVEFDAGTAEPTAGWAWLDLDAGVIARLEPAWSRAAVARWARERAEGWSSLRPAWSHPGWLARASTWMVEQMAAHGRPAIGPVQQHQLWSISVILRCPSEDGDVYFKSSTGVFRHEAAVTQALAERMPDLVPEVIAVESAEGWMLMRDLAAPELGDLDESLWHQGLASHAGIQRSWLGRTDELVALGLPVRSMADLAAQVEVGPRPTLVHGDLHPWNVTLGANAVRVFDWTDAAVSHPFVDLATYVFRTSDLPVRRRMVDAYVEAWSAEASWTSLREAAALGLVVGALYQVQTYRALLPTLVRNGADDDMADADLDWINRSLTRHHQGLESPA
jgi:hypothetical protein